MNLTLKMLTVALANLAYTSRTTSTVSTAVVTLSQLAIENKQAGHLSI